MAGDDRSFLMATGKLPSARLSSYTANNRPGTNATSKSSRPRHHRLRLFRAADRPLSPARPVIIFCLGASFSVKRLIARRLDNHRDVGRVDRCLPYSGLSAGFAFFSERYRLAVCLIVLLEIRGLSGTQDALRLTEVSVVSFFFANHDQNAKSGAFSAVGMS